MMLKIMKIKKEKEETEDVNVMNKKQQPKVKDLMEIFLIKLDQFEKAYEKVLGEFSEVNTHNTKILSSAIKNLKKVNVDLDLTEIKNLQNEHLEATRKEFVQFNNQINVYNSILFKMHNKIRNKLLFTGLFFFAFFFSVAIFSTYHALKKTIKQDDYETLLKEKIKYKNDAVNYKSFITRDQKTIDEYNEWVE